MLLPARIEALPTPSLVLDRKRLVENLERMQRRATQHKVQLRPHLKTAKSAQIAQLATREHRQITVSTVAEAEYFATHGFRDITYAVCITPEKLPRVLALYARGVTCRLLTDSRDMVDALAQALEPACKYTIPILIEIDSGEHRTGICHDNPELIAIASAIQTAPNLKLDGVLTHGGHSYDARSLDELRRIAEDERAAVVGAANTLRSAGFACPSVSAGSTPTCTVAKSFAGLTEIRPGVYMFSDLMQVSLGVATHGEIAASVVATVISHQKAHNRIVIDAGALALSKDQTANRLLKDANFGWVCDLSNGERIGDLSVRLVDQEHGYVDGTDIPFDRLAIGSKVRVLPNHACITAACFDHYWVYDNGEIVAKWDRTRGW